MNNTRVKYPEFELSGPQCMNCGEVCIWTMSLDTKLCYYKCSKCDKIQSVMPPPYGGKRK